MAGSELRTRRGAGSEKAESIVAAAQSLFLEDGYATTSMDAIALKSGVSKPTLYSHFQSKEGLFAGVMCRMCEEIGFDAYDGVETEGPPEVVLKSLATDMCRRLIQSEQGRALLRTVICEAPAFPELGRVAWQTGPRWGREMLADYLAGLDGQGEVNVPDPVLAAGMFFGMVTGPFLMPVLFGAEDPPSDAVLSEILDTIVATFLKGIAI